MDHSGHNMHDHMMHMKDMDDMGDMGGMDGMDGMDMNDTCNCGMDMDMDMAMTFHGGYDEKVLFEFWVIDTVWKLILSMIGIMIIAFLYEGLKYAREYLFRQSISKSQYTSSDKSNVTIADPSAPVRYMEQIIMPPAEVQARALGERVCDEQLEMGQLNFTEDSALLADSRKELMSVKMMSMTHFVQTLLHMLQFFVSYCLMLVFMTYNVWLCLACLLGSGAGYFFFGWRKSVVVDITEHCH